MRTSLIAASVGAVVTVLTAGVAPSKAEPMAQAYPYCALRAGSTSCYHQTLESCGRSCISNPAYVDNRRARATLAGVGLANDSIRAKPKANVTRSAQSAPKTIGAIDAGARASASLDNGFKGWPTGYLVNRLGDHQAQGRF